jgi:hypothetical protein
VPTSSANITTIRTGHTIRANSSITIDQLTINLGGTLNYTTGLITLSNGAGDDMIVEGVFNHNGGTALSIQSAATVRIRAGGEIRASANATGIGDLYAGNGATAFTYETNAIFHWNISLVFASVGQTYFGNSGTNVPIFLITENVGNVGANTFTTFNGVLEVNGSVIFDNTGIKTLRNGIRGSGTVTQAATTTGKLLISNNNSVLGIANLVLNTNGLEINHTGTTTMTRATSVTGGRINLIAGKINLNGFNLNLGTNGQIQEDRANNHFITDLTATTEANKGGAIIANNRTVNATARDIAGIGLSLQRTTGADYTVNISRYHYMGGFGLGIKKIYSITSATSPIPATNLRITYAEGELNPIGEPLVISRWSSTSGWSSFAPDLSDFNANYAERQGITAFSTWTLSSESLPLPVSLINFEGNRDTEGKITLQWQTIQEQDNLGFDVEVSEDGQTFEHIAFVEGQGNSSSFSEYEFSYDKFQAAYYRLKQIDSNGALSYSPTLFISEFVPKVLLYPNPIQFGQSLKIIGLEANKLYQISLRDAQGQTLQSFQSKGLEVSKILETKILFLNAGVYFLEIRGTTQKTVLKLVKN